MHVSMKYFGESEESDIILFTFTNKNGCVLQVLNFGATLHSWQIHDQNGQLDDILLGCKDADGYRGNHPYFGCVVGRVANRISYGTFELDGHKYQLDTNLGEHHLHGGTNGWNKQCFSHQLFPQDDRVTIQFIGKSSTGDQGYPGNVEYMITYTYTDDNEIIMEYRAVSDAPTPINMTNHAYFNLDGSKNILNHQVMIKSNKITSYNNDLIPTGDFTNIEDTALDLRSMVALGEQIDLNNALLKISKGFDHNYVLDEHNENEVVASAYSPISGRLLEVCTTEPAIQLYTGNWLNGVTGKQGIYSDYAGFCLETQHFPDSVNHPHFPSTILMPDDLYYSRTMYKVSVKQEV